MIVSTPAFVLKSFDFRETSRIVTFYTKSHGKIKGILKGIRKDSRKFGSSVDLFSLNDIVFYESRRSDLHLVSQCDLKAYHSSIRTDYKKNLAAHYAVELIDAVMPVESANDDVYLLLGNYLDALEKASDVDKILHFFQIKILLHSGFRPHLDACVQCGREVSGRARFSLQAGGLVCKECPAADNSFTIISPGVIFSILHIEENHWRQCLNLGLTTSIKKELRFVLNNFLLYHLEKKMNTEKYLQCV